MVRQIKKKSIGNKFKDILTSPFILPFSLFLFVIFTLPVIYFISQNQIDIRQRAATITGGSIAINTEDGSYSKAVAELAPANAVNWSIGLILIIVIVVAIIAIVAYRRKISTF